MKLYHGCSARRVPSILSKGLQPRFSGRSNWHDYPSRTDMVYLSQAYPFYYAINSGDAEKCAVFEIDTSLLQPRLFHPDEDFVVQALVAGNGGSVKDIHDEIRDDLETYQQHWRESLKRLGNCCYQGAIPPECITRYCIFHVSARPNLAMELLSPQISLRNYAVTGQHYRHLVEWMFGDRKLLPMVVWNRNLVKQAHADVLERWKGLSFDPAKSLRMWERESTDRSGIEVLISGPHRNDGRRKPKRTKQ
jgi:hypothetical protein